jgi:hypothetical protein
MYLLNTNAAYHQISQIRIVYLLFIIENNIKIPENFLIFRLTPYHNSAKNILPTFGTYLERRFLDL